MVLTVSWSLLSYNLLTIPCLIVIPLTLLSEHMSNVISIILLKLITIYFLAKLLAPELHGFVYSEAQSLQK